MQNVEVKNFKVFFFFFFWFNVQNKKKPNKQKEKEQTQENYKPVQHKLQEAEARRLVMDCRSLDLDTNASDGGTGD